VEENTADKEASSNKGQLEDNSDKKFSPNTILKIINYSHILFPHFSLSLSLTSLLLSPLFLLYLIPLSLSSYYLCNSSLTRLADRKPSIFVVTSRITNFLTESASSKHIICKVRKKWRKGGD
jgi:hypothetical protein